ncbi:hypothetical protein [Nocardioides donggukensis]|uniref:Uncharacterized protein n=1 Tax=Nocardioides donggukensis TaxID=2774019 RepID=A0A927K2U3_9ACTN|nr:hypothetical protein [Nocardioides donggukensis]MBD8869304.1 hypothetical protein [Nocardioides donggukensis]
MSLAERAEMAEIVDAALDNLRPRAVIPPHLIREAELAATREVASRWVQRQVDAGQSTLRAARDEVSIGRFRTPLADEYSRWAGSIRWAGELAQSLIVLAELAVRLHDPDSLQGFVRGLGLAMQGLTLQQLEALTHPEREMLLQAWNEVTAAIEDRDSDRLVELQGYFGTEVASILVPEVGPALRSGGLVLRGASGYRATHAAELAMDDALRQLDGEIARGARQLDEDIARNIRQFDEDLAHHAGSLDQVTHGTVSGGGGAPGSMLDLMRHGPGGTNGPATVEWIEAVGRVDPPAPRPQGRGYALARLVDSWGDRVRWVPADRGGALVEVTMRYLPEQRTTRAARHEPTSRAHRQRREAEAQSTLQYDSGHVRPAIMDGIAEAITSFPQHRRMNQATYRAIEARVRRIVEAMPDAGSGVAVHDRSVLANIKFRYDSREALRRRTPDEFVVTIRFEGRTQGRLRVYNDQRGSTIRFEEWNPHARVQDPLTGATVPANELYGVQGADRLLQQE